MPSARCQHVARLDSSDLATGKSAVWERIVPTDAAGVDAIGGLLTRDAKSFVYSHPRTLSDLYVVEGLK